MQIVELRKVISEGTKRWGITDTETLNFYPMDGILNGVDRKPKFTLQNYLEVRDRLVGYPLHYTLLYDPELALPAFMDVEVSVKLSMTPGHLILPKGRKFKT